MSAPKIQLVNTDTVQLVPVGAPVTFILDDETSYYGTVAPWRWLNNAAMRCLKGSVRVEPIDWPGVPAWKSELGEGQKFVVSWDAGEVAIPAGAKIRLTNLQSGSGSVTAELHLVLAGHPAHT